MYLAYGVVKAITFQIHDEHYFFQTKVLSINCAFLIASGVGGLGSISSEVFEHF